MSSENPYLSSESSRMVPAPPTDIQSLLFSFQGRVPRRIYWMVALGAGIAAGAFEAIAQAVLGADSTITHLIAAVAGIAALWAHIAVGVKRWHDRNKSGFWILLAFVPCIGQIWTFIEAGCLRGTVGPNEYGADPT